MESSSRKNLLAMLTGLSALVCPLSCLPALAGPLLHGAVEESRELPTGEIGQAEISETLAELKPDSFPVSFVGNWQCVSIVVDSVVPGVIAGQQISSQMSFLPDSTGKVTAFWNQPGWTETQCDVSAYNARQFKSERTNFFQGDGTSRAWAARSRDEYTVQTVDQLVAFSEVEQYLDGRFLGRYRTKSVLVRACKPDNLAFYKQ